MTPDPMQVHLVKKEILLEVKTRKFFPLFKKNTAMSSLGDTQNECFFLSARDKIPFAFKMTRGHFGQWCFDIPVCVAPNTNGCV